MRNRHPVVFAIGILLTASAGIAAAQTAPPPATQPSPRELWERVEKALPPFTYRVLKDEMVPSDTDPREKLRRIELRFTSQIIEGKPMDHTAVVFMPADPAINRAPARRGKVVIVGQRWNDTSMLFNYGDPIATRTGYPTMVIPIPGEFDGLDGEGRWMTFLRTLTQKDHDAANHNYFRLAVPYLRGIRIFSEILGEKDIHAVIGGHSKRATSAFTAAAIDPEHIVGVVYMGNESKFSAAASDTFRPVSPFYTQKYVKCPVLYVGATNEDGYEMFNINKIQAIMERPWAIEYIPNYRHATASEVQFRDWQMWVAHIFDGRPLARIDNLRWEETKDGTLFRARVRTPNKIVQIKFWYVYCDDVYWRDLVWYPAYPHAKGNDEYEAFVDGVLPDAWFVEVKDTAMGFPGYLSSLPQDITHKPTRERVSHGWKSRLWRPRLPAPAASQPASEYFPGPQWEQPGPPEQYGWSTAGLDNARQYADSIGSSAVFIVHHGRLVCQWGQTDRRYDIHSMRKSFLSALYGLYVRSGTIRLSDTVGKLGIDDNEPRLTAVEKQATVGDLLRARSGVYHVAAYETPAMKAARPARFSHAPGTFWYYNNWDFNVLGTIFRNTLQTTIGREFQLRIAEPLQMEDFRLQDARQVLDPESIHPAYPFRMTARDMARFGLMFLRQGRWRDRQIIPADWVTESTRSYSAVRDAHGQVRAGYGYMWWTELDGQHLENVDLPKGSFSARGSGGQYILVVPGLDLVIVHCLNTDRPLARPVNRPQFGGLVRRIVDAMPADQKQAAATRATTRPAGRRWLPDALDELVPRLLESHKVPGVSIVGIENGRISWERQYGVRSADSREPVDSQTIFEACSMSKLPFAYAVMKLVEQGRLDLDRPLVEYLDKPYLPDEPRHRLITARMVLSHTTGFPNWREGGWDSGGPLHLLCDPGTRFTYSGEGFLYLQRVVEHITGTPIQPYLRQTIFDPLGIAISSYVWENRYEKLAAAGHDDKGQVKPNRPHYPDANVAFSLYCTPAEYATFLVEIMKPDRSAPQSLSEASIAAMLTRTTRADGHRSVDRSGTGNSDVPYWGLGWAIDATSSGDRIYHSGSNGTGFRCYCEFDRQRGSGIVIMTNAVNGDALWKAIMASVGEPPAQAGGAKGEGI
jgi:CubicO group peptidase (beta-lactamase class C family)